MLYYARLQAIIFHAASWLSLTPYAAEIFLPCPDTLSLCRCSIFGVDVFADIAADAFHYVSSDVACRHCFRRHAFVYAMPL